MSVITTADIERDVASGYEDPSLPIGIWRVTQQSTGDVSGGTNAVQINLKAAATAPGNLFSLEEIYFDDEDATAALFALVSLSGLEGWAPGLQTRTFTIPGNIPSGTGDIAGNVNKPQLFLGRGANTATAGTISVVTRNNNGLEFEVSASGYMWQPRSLTAQGGPSRPIRGRFPN